MGTAKQDFERFVRWLHEPTQRASEPSRRFANLVLTNFDSVAGRYRQHNNRSQRLAQLARPNLAVTSADLPQFQGAAPEAGWPWVRLQRLTLGPFRGFREPVTFDLSKRLVLCYGPNGSGKTSLCEALEYALRGSVEEAGSKRIADADYLRNIHAGRFDPPVLTATDANRQIIRVQANEDAFRFFFVEKNRIDNFSRIAAAPPGRRGDLIAALFGMEQFNEFVSHFNESMEPVLSLSTLHQTQLTVRRQALAADEALVANEAAQLEQIDQEANNWAHAFSRAHSLQGLKDFIGTDEVPGRLHALSERLRSNPPAIVGVTRDHLRQLYRAMDAGEALVAAAAGELARRRTQISFRDLFFAVQTLQAGDPHLCPACLTPINDTAVNPFSRAEEGLRTLAELAEIEDRHQRSVRALELAGRTLRDELRKLEGFLEGNGENGSPICMYLRALPPDPEATWWSSVYHPEGDVTGATPSLEQLLEVVDRVSAQDIQTREILAARNADTTELERLNYGLRYITAHDIRRARLIEEAVQARNRIAQWEQANAHLIRRAALEETDNRRDRPIGEAYSDFIDLLNQFRSQLPGMLIADLNSVAMDLYNEFNFGDRDEDKLSDLRLPMTGDQIIEVAFRGNPGRRWNALQTLSEGHIRCLGLAILLGKASAAGAPLIIFDDAINAIDHDHRSGIRSAIFESDRFRQTQVIVTCHSPEFVKDIENHLPQLARRDCQQYTLLHHNGNYQPRVNPDVGTLNYLDRAREAIDERNNPRDALTFARKALEMLTDKSWKWLESHRIGNIYVVVEGPGKEPQLRNLCDALRHKLQNSQTFAHPSKQPLLDALLRILGIPAQNLIWTLLNKGTHEEPNRDDFDLVHVETVLHVLRAIDGLELRQGR